MTNLCILHASDNSGISDNDIQQLNLLELHANNN